MSLSIVGNQYAQSGDVKGYVVSGIGSMNFGFIQMPDGWSVNTDSGIIAGVQSFTLNVGIGSGTIIVDYYVIIGGNIIHSQILLDVYSSACKMGEEIKQEGVLYIPSQRVARTSIICETPRCTFPIEVFADLNNPTIDIQNDMSDFFGNIGGVAYYGYANTTAITLTMQKLVGSVWADQFIVIDNTYGQFFPYGKANDFSGNNFTDDYGKQYTGFIVKWNNILSVFGDGKYRMKLDYSDVIVGSYTLYDVRLFCLYQWNCFKPNGTIRIDFSNKGLRGTLYDETVQIDHYNGWNSQIRLRGLFLYKNSGYVKEYNQYGDAEYDVYKPIINEQTPKFSLTKLYIPGWVAWYLSTNVMQADSILVTDYNTSNRMSLVKTPLMIDGDFTIPENNLVDPTGDINIATKIGFAYGQNSLRRRNS